MIARHCALPLVSSFLLLGSSCAVRRPPGGEYRLVRAGSNPVLLTPAVPRDIPDDRPIAIPISAAGALKRADASKCAVKGELFKLVRAGEQWEIRLPALRLWRESEAGAEIQQGFDEFFGQLEMPERERCLGSDGAVLATALLQESLPSAPADSLYYRYRYRLGDGFVDLGPGMALQMERAHFEPGATAQNLANYLGTTTLEYEVLPDKRDRLQFKPAGVARNPATLDVPAGALPEAKLPAHTRRMPFYRLFISNEFVPKRFQRAAILVGAMARSRIEEATRALKARPDTTCSEAPLAGLDCIAFEGRITVSAQLRASVQGQLRRLHVGTRLAALIGSEIVPSALRIERRYRGTYVPVEFTPGDKGVLDLAVIGGDRISW